MSFQNELNTHAKSVDEVVTYLEGERPQIAFLDLGSADLRIVGEKGQAMIIITTSSGHAASIPAELFAQLV